MACRGAFAVAERLGTTPVSFPSGHGGFLGGEYGQTGDPMASPRKNARSSPRRKRGRLSAMTDTLRVILEIGKKRRVVAGAMDWPGLDRWGTSEDDALDEAVVLSSRATPASPNGPAWRSAFARARDVEVVERVPGSSSTDFWGIAHVPSQIEREVLSPADLERRLDLLRACWAHFDDVAARVSAELRPGARSAGRSRDQIIRHVYLNEPEPVLAQGRGPDAARRRPHPGRPRDASAGIPRRHPRLQRRRQAGADLADPVPRAPHRPPRHGSRVGDGGPGPHIVSARVLGRETLRRVVMRIEFEV